MKLNCLMKGYEANLGKSFMNKIEDLEKHLAITEMVMLSRSIIQRFFSEYGNMQNSDYSLLCQCTKIEYEIYQNTRFVV